MARYLGVDGCPAGWFASWIDHGELAGAIYPTIEQLHEHHDDAVRILVDMPIGLMDREERLLESEIRQLIGPRRSSVFPVPCYDAAYAKDYPTANRLNREIIGKGLSKQAWFLCPKIKEINDYLTSNPGSKQIFCESHPELVFSCFNGIPMMAGKRTKEGSAARMKVLSGVLPDVEPFVTHTMNHSTRRDLTQDDCLDALVLLAAAELATELETEVKQIGVGNTPVRMWVPKAAS